MRRNQRAETQLFTAPPLLLIPEEGKLLQSRKSVDFGKTLRRLRGNTTPVKMDEGPSVDNQGPSVDNQGDQKNNEPVQDNEVAKKTKMWDQYRGTLRIGKPSLGPPKLERATSSYISGNMGSKSVSSPAISFLTRVPSKKFVLQGSFAPRLHREAFVSMFTVNTSSQRNKVIKEIMATEADFIDDCDIIINIYFATLQKSNLLSDKQLEQIFSNLVDIRYTNLEFFQELMRLIPVLEDKPHECPDIGGLFSQIPTRFHCYEKYLSQHEISMQALKEAINSKKDVAEILSTCAAHPETGKLDLASFLIKPIQRICKYPLLLRELKKSLGPDEQTQALKCENAILEIENFISAANDKMKNHEKMEMIKKHLGKNEFILLLLEGRTIIKEGRLLRIKKEAKEKYFWLLDNCILWCKLQKKTSILPQKFQKTNRRMIPLINVISVQGTEMRTVSFTFSIMYTDEKNKQRTLVLSAESYLEKLLWVHTLEKFL